LSYGGEYGEGDDETERYRREYDEEEKQESEEAKESPEEENEWDPEKAMDEIERKLKEIDDEWNPEDAMDEIERKLEGKSDEEDEFEKHGIDHKETQDRLDDEFSDDAKDKIDEWETDSQETQDSEGETGAQTGETAEDESYHDAGDGMAYATKHDGESESSEAPSETEESESEREAGEIDGGVDSEVEESKGTDSETAPDSSNKAGGPESSETYEYDIEDRELETSEDVKENSERDTIEEPTRQERDSNTASGETEEQRSESDLDEDSEQSQIEEPEVDESNAHTDESGNQNDASDDSESSLEEIENSPEIDDEIDTESEQDDELERTSDFTPVSEGREVESEIENEADDLEKNEVSDTDDDSMISEDETNQTVEPEELEQVEVDGSESEGSEEIAHTNAISRSEFSDMSWENNQYSDMELKSQYEGMKWGSLFPDVEEDSTDEEEKLEEARKLLEELTESKIETIEELERTIEENKDVKEDSAFEAAFEYAKAYLELKQKVKEKYTKEEFEELNHVDLAREFGYRIADVSNWMRGNIPKLIAALEKHEKLNLQKQILRELQFQLKVNDKPESETAAIPKSIEEIDSLLKFHSHLMEHKKFQKRYKDLVAFYKIMQLISKNPDMTARELGRRVNVPDRTVRHWINAERTPRLLYELLKCEHRRRIDNSFKENEYENTIDDSDANRILAKVERRENIKTDDLAQLIRDLYKLIQSSETNRVFLVNVTEYPKLKKGLNTRREEILSILSQTSFGLDEDTEIRIAVVHGKLYIHIRNTDPYDWLTVHGNHHMHFADQKLKERLVNATCARLYLSNNMHLSELIREITDFSSRVTISHYYKGTNIDLAWHKPNRTYLLGETLRLVLDTLGLSFDDVKDQIEEVSGLRRGISGIKNPTFITGEKLRIAMSRIVASWLSDGHVGTYDSERNYAPNYAELSPGRLTQFKDNLRLFGDVYYNERTSSNTKMKLLAFTKVWSDILVAWGLHHGNKTVQNVGIPDFILNGSSTVKLAYLEELVCEDGYVETEKSTFRITIVRASPLRAGKNDERYNFESKISDRHVEFLIEHGELDQFLQGIRFSWKKLRELMEHESKEISNVAHELAIIILQNTSRLLDNEMRIADEFNITLKPELTSLYYYTRTGRVSIMWEARTATVEDSIRWGLLAKPNDTRKRKAVEDALKKRPNKVKKVREEILRRKKDKEEVDT
jgi:hypothetical protein